MRSVKVAVTYNKLASYSIYLRSVSVKSCALARGEKEVIYKDKETGKSTLKMCGTYSHLCFTY
jgi:hypothetical protein